MIVGGFAFILGSAMQAAASGITMLVIGRVILGVAIGFANQVRTSLEKGNHAAHGDQSFHIAL